MGKEGSTPQGFEKIECTVDLLALGFSTNCLTIKLLF